jgi:aldose 1-epimerase
MLREPYGRLADGSLVERFTLENAHGTRARIISYGGIVTSLEVGGRNVVLGCADLAGYVADDSYFGALIGRYGNRIARGRFALDGGTYQLVCNNPPNALHGGPRGFHKALWDADPVGARLVLRHRSPDGDEGYPGNLDIEVAYGLSEDDALTIEYTASTDQPTIVNPTNHSYFNLAGEGSGDVYGHEVTLFADAFTPVDATLIPTGDILPVTGTPFDFRTATPIGARLRRNDEQLMRARGYDHNFVLRSPGSLGMAARVVEPQSGLAMQVWTDQPGFQFYSGNFLDGSKAGPSGRAYRQGDGFCLETQHFPDSPNQPGFPSTVLRPGDVLRSQTEYRFTRA